MKTSSRTILVVATLLLASGSGSVAAQSYYGIPIEESGVAFLLDVSGSMEDKDEGQGQNGRLGRGAIRGLTDAARRTKLGQSRAGQAILNRAESETTKLGSARRELFSALGSLTGWTKFTIISFGEQAQEWPGGIRLAGRTERIAAQTYALSLSADGGTLMAEALSLAFAHPDVYAIFLVSDGRPTSGEVRGLVRDLQRNRNGKEVIINTVGIGGDQDAELMCDLARENHGVYVRDGQVLCSPSPCPSDHQLVTYYRQGHPHRHEYSVKTPICSVTQRGCTAEAVYSIMLTRAQYGAPTLSGSSVSDCMDLDLSILDWASYKKLQAVLGVVGLGKPDPVTIDLDAANLSWSNYTRPGHVFHPGKITRTVRTEGKSVVVETIGVGTGDYALPNKMLGKLIFSSVDEDLKKAVTEKLRE